MCIMAPANTKRMSKYNVQVFTWKKQPSLLLLTGIISELANQVRVMFVHFTNVPTIYIENDKKGLCKENVEKFVHVNELG